MENQPHDTEVHETHLESNNDSKSAIWAVVVIIVLALLGYLVFANNDDNDTLPEDVTNPAEFQGEFEPSDRVLDAESNAEAQAEIRPGLDKI